jgi:hypothetical protein
MQPSTVDRRDIGPVKGLDIVGMPVLDSQVRAHPQAHRGVHVLYIKVGSPWPVVYA